MQHARGPSFLRLICLCLLTLLGASASYGCLWDRDTLQQEAKDISDVMQVIAGAFPRNPPRYYEMRLERVTRELEQDPSNLAAYDDAGVACDRLGRSFEAVAWMEKKRVQLDTLAKAGRADAEHRYRYLANLGTFLVHRWIRAGADRENLNEVRKARDCIEAAIKLNPRAHFGRERYQFKALEWLISPPPASDLDNWIPDFLGLPRVLAMADGGELAKMGYADAVRGIGGLIVLGDGWNSVDMFNALAHALQAEGRSSIAQLATLRCQELVDAGKRPLFQPKTDPAKLRKSVGMPFSFVENTDTVIATFRKMRSDADQWQEKRIAYMMERLNAGRHPDTDPSFWNDFKIERPTINVAR